MSADPADRADQTAIAAVLLAWYDAERRALPWRGSRDPYAIWVSEVMLQQTQVATVIPYYQRFTARFPTVQALAAATLDEVLTEWQGLGYYTRARHLHAAALAICAQHGGVLPAAPKALRGLPGIGAYTAAAILSIAYGQDVAAVDANVTRVICRLYDDGRDPKSGVGRQFVQAQAQALLPPGRAGDFNQAMMDLGATVCLPQAPTCGCCPIRGYCQALAAGTQALRPAAATRERPPLRAMAAALIVRGERVLIVRRRPWGLLGGLWELPACTVVGAVEAAPAALARGLAADLGLAIDVGQRLALVRHAYTHLRLAVEVFACKAEGEPAPAGAWDRCHWLAADERGAYGLSSLTAKILARVPWPGAGLLL
ncbi:MAG: A/G-specific adenine glycosylase [Chloroflexota bacterium]